MIHGWINLKDSFIESIDKYGGMANVKCVKLNTAKTTYVLKVNHTKIEEDMFLDSINFNVEQFPKTLQVAGTIWLKDGTWFERVLDDIEFWEYNEYPTIPEECL